MQIKFLIFIVGLLLVGTTLNFIKSYATPDKTEFRFAVQIGDGNRTYSPIFKVDLNLSPADSLELIPGIGPVLASRIISHRDSVGRFEKPSDVMDVQGIGFGTFEKIKPYIEVQPW